MEDQNAEPVQNEPSDSAPPASPVADQSATDPHPVEEDPEEHVGRRRKDPWSDDNQTDWPNNDLELADDGSEQGENS